MIILNEIFFLVFAFLTVFLSIKLSYYADSLSKHSKVSKALIGGIVLAGVTSLPEFITSFSALLIGNNLLAMGDVLGSNIFNIFMVCVFDIIFMKKMMFTYTSKRHNLVIGLLIINYIVLYFFVSKMVFFSIFKIGIPTLVIIFSYLFYLKATCKEEKEEVYINEEGYTKSLVLKLIGTAILMIVASGLLTIVVNNLAILHPAFSSSFLGAIFLGVTTSLPEVVTFYALFSLKSYDLALANILGSNLFNLLVLAVCDLVTLGSSIYGLADKDTVFIVFIGLLFSVICFFLNIRKNVKSTFSYVWLSGIVVLIYLGFWIAKFI